MFFYYLHGLESILNVWVETVGEIVHEAFVLWSFANVFTCNKLRWTGCYRGKWKGWDRSDRFLSILGNRPLKISVITLIRSSKIASLHSGCITLCAPLSDELKNRGNWAALSDAACERFWARTKWTLKCVPFVLLYGQLFPWAAEGELFQTEYYMRSVAMGGAIEKSESCALCNPV